MALTVAVPAEAMRGRHSFGDDHLGADYEAPERGPAQNQIAEMAVLLGNTRGSVILGGSVLSALTIGIALEAALDRKSTRLNSSHSQISYAVFCLKKKKNLNSQHTPSCDEDLEVP